MMNNWFMTKYSLPTIALSYCKNTDANGNWCKPKREVDVWLKTKAQYFVYQDTRVQSDIWEDNKIVDEHPYYGDKSNYFPTLKSMNSYNFGPINIDPEMRDTHL